MRTPLRLLVFGLTLASGPVLAQDGPLAVGARLAVTGRATADVAPDHATVMVGVSARGATAAAALDETSAAAAKVAAAARAFGGIEPRDIRTSQVSLQPLYKNVREAGGGSRQQPDGYAASNSVSIRMRELPRLGEFLRRSVDEGASQLSGIAFGITDRAKAERDAQATAVANARRDAETLAGAAGLRLGRILEIRSGEAGGVMPRRMQMQEFRSAGPDIPVEPGQIEVAATVEIVWTMEAP